MSTQTREIIFNPSQTTFTPTLLQDGYNIITEITKIPSSSNEVSINDDEFYSTNNPFINDEIKTIIPNIKRKNPKYPIDYHKLYSITEELKLTKRKYDEDKLIDLAKTMIGVEGDNTFDPLSMKNSSLPALFTYFGHFLLKGFNLVDIPDLEQEININNLINDRKSIFDINYIFEYPNIYDENGFINISNISLNHTKIQENKIIYRIHLLFYKFYNKIFFNLKTIKPFNAFSEICDEVKKTIKYTWQWIIIHSFLKLACGSYFSSLFLENGEPNFHIIKPNKNGKLNAEFCLGINPFISLNQEEYYFNGIKPIFTKPNESIKIDKEILIDWGFFWPLEGYMGFQQTHRFGTTISHPVNKKQSAEPENYLKRQNQMMFASGQDLAREFGIPEKLIINDIKIIDNNFVFNESIDQNRILELENYFKSNTPLFYYILYEARTLGNGEHLGPLGTKIFGLTILSQLYSDPESYIFENWTPKKDELGCRENGVYSVEDFIRYSIGKPYPKIPILIPNIHTNFFNPESNLASKEIINEKFTSWTTKIKCSLGPNDTGKNLIIINNLKNSLSNIIIQVYNNTKREIIETITMDFEDKYAELNWNGEEYTIIKVNTDKI